MGTACCLATFLLVESLLLNIEGKYVSGHMFFVDLKRRSAWPHNPEVIFYPLWMERRVGARADVGEMGFSAPPVNTI